MVERRRRSDSVEASIDAHRGNLAEVIVWPETAPKMVEPEDQAEALVVYQSIMSSRAARDFRHGGHDHILAAELAFVTIMGNKALSKLDAFGIVLRSSGKSNAIVSNPLLQAWHMLSNRRSKLTTQLGLAGSTVDPRTVSKNAATQNDADAAKTKVPEGRQLLAKYN